MQLVETLSPVPQLIDQVMRSRLFCRPRRKGSLPTIQRKLLQATRQELSSELEGRFACGRQRSSELGNFELNQVKLLRDRAFKNLLNGDNLEELALVAQSHSCATPVEQRYALGELINALKLSGKLRCRGHYSEAIYEDAVQQTLCWVALNIESFNPKQGRFLPWVNYRLDKMLQQVYTESLDPFLQSQRAQVLRCKYQLTEILSQASQWSLASWLTFIAKGISISHEVTVWLILLWQLAQWRRSNRSYADSLFQELAQASLSLVQRVDGETVALDSLAQPEEEPSLSEQVKAYIQSDPEGLCQKHIRNCREATFQKLCWARLEGQSWPEIAASFGLTVTGVKKFFLRYLRKIAPEIKRYIQQ